MTAASYPHLDAFLGGWFHQDFDLVGDTLEEIVAAYRESAGVDEAEAVRSDIAAFLLDSAGAVEDDLGRVFVLDIDPLGFAPSARRLPRIDRSPVEVIGRS